MLIGVSGKLREYKMLASVTVNQSGVNNQVFNIFSHLFIGLKQQIKLVIFSDSRKRHLLFSRTQGTHTYPVCMKHHLVRLFESQLLTIKWLLSMSCLSNVLYIF